MSEIPPRPSDGAPIVSSACPALKFGVPVDLETMDFIFVVDDCERAFDGSRAITEISASFCIDPDEDDENYASMHLVEADPFAVPAESDLAWQAKRIASSRAAKGQVRASLCDRITRCPGPTNGDCWALGSTAMQRVVHEVAQSLDQIADAEIEALTHSEAASRAASEAYYTLYTSSPPLAEISFLQALRVAYEFLEGAGSVRQSAKAGLVAGLQKLSFLFTETDEAGNPTERFKDDMLSYILERYHADTGNLQETIYDLHVNANLFQEHKEAARAEAGESWTAMSALEKVNCVALYIITSS